MKVVRGVQISGYGHQELALDLEQYCAASPLAALHVAAAATAGATIKSYREGKLAHCSGTEVQISRDACLGPSGLTSPVYLVETVLFELKNAINAARYGKQKAQSRAGTISLLRFGVDKAYLEFESTETTAQILAQIRTAGMPLSPWGQGQITGYAQGRDFFADQPHDAAGQGHMRLPTKLLYPYELLQDTVQQIKNMKLELKKVAIVQKNGVPLSGIHWGPLIGEFGKLLDTPAQFLVHYVHALSALSREPGWTVNWDGGFGIWDDCVNAFVLTAPTIVRDPLMETAIKGQLMAALA